MPDASPGAALARAGLARRLASLTYEALLAAALVLVAGFALAPLMSPSVSMSMPLSVPGAGRRAAGFVIIAVVAGIYFVWCWTGGRRTLPMKTWRMRLVDAAGAPPGTRRAIVRYLAAWIGPALAVALFAATHSRAAWFALAAGYLWGFVDRDRAFLHDRIAGTRIVRG